MLYKIVLLLGRLRGKKFGNKAKARGNKNWQHGERRNNVQEKIKCTRCGIHHDLKGKCPAMGKTCSKCGKNNHFGRMCRTKTVSELSHAPREFRSEGQGSACSCKATAQAGENTLFLGSLDTVEKEPQWRETFTVLNRNINFKVDTGADVSVISESVYRSLSPRPKLVKSSMVLQSPGGRVENLGQFVVHANRNDRKISFRVFVIKGETDNLLGRDAAVRLGLVKRIDANSAKDLAFGTVGEPVKTDPVKIELRPGVEPYSISVARRIPLPLMPKVETELKRMEECGVIERISEPTDWCAPMVPVLKKNGDVRICVDLKHLNRAVKRERYTLPTLEDMTHKLAGSKVYSKLDAASGFWQIPLDEGTAKYTTFMTPFGRYFFKRLPFGINLAPEIFQRIMQNIIGSCEGVVCFMDDVLVYGHSADEHDRRLNSVLEHMSKAGLKLNREKCEFKKQTVQFSGHKIDADGIQPDPSKISAITEMQEPRDVPELCRFLGMVNYLGRFVPNLADVLHPLNELLHKDTLWTWGPSQKQAFSQIKQILSSSQTLTFFRSNRPTVVCSDASSYGLGGVLYQEVEGEMKPVAYCSRSLTDAEKRYAQIEKECLAIVYSCEKFERYLVGLPNFRLLTDHRPLIPLLNKKDLIDTPLRCQRMLMRLMRYNLTAEYVPGKTLVVADALSRAPLINSENCPADLEKDVFAHVDSVRMSWSVTDRKLEELRKATDSDIQLNKVLCYVRLGWPEYKEDCALAAREFYGIKDELSEYAGLVTRGGRIVIPWSQREYVLERIHDGHQGINKCRERANQAVWWPGMGQAIKEMVGRCRFCCENRTSQMKEPLIISSLPEYPFQRIGVDLCEFRGENFLIAVDYYSRFIEISRLGKTTAGAVIEELKTIFARYGIPEVLVSDNGPQFSSSEFKNFALKWNFTHITSSPHYAQSNGEAEKAVQTAKGLLRQEDFQFALLAYRATPIPSLGYSPTELAFGRKVRTSLPALPASLVPQTPQAEALKDIDAHAKLQQKHYFDRHYGVKPLPELTPGDKVLIKCDGEKGWKQTALVMNKCASRSYMVQTPEGSILRRNRRHLQKVQQGDSPTPPKQQPSQDSAVDNTVPDDSRAQTCQPAEASRPSPEPALPPGPDNQPAAVLPMKEGPITLTTRSGRIIKRPSRFD